MATRRFRFLWAPAAAGLLLGPLAALPASENVEGWVAGELADYVYEQVSTAPRLASATVHLVVFADGQPASLSDELSLALRDGLRQRLAGRSGIRLGWQPDPAAAVGQLPSTAEHCRALEPDVLVGLEVRGDGEGTATVSVRALDDDERRWIPGFGREWRGRLTAAQVRAFSTAAFDRTYLGRRDVPYEATESDLIARHLARDLRCQLMRRVSGEYRLAVADIPEKGDALAAVPALVRRQVGGVSSLKLLAAGEAPNAELEGRLHPVAGGLHQYWLVLEPVGATENLQPIASSVYVAMPPHAAARGEDGGAPVMPAPMSDVLSDIRLVRLAADPACRRPGSSASLYRRTAGPCTALRITARTDAVVFILNHQNKLGLVRLGDDYCAPRPRAYVLRRGESVTVRVPDLAAFDDADWSVLPAWSISPGAEAWYAIAADDSDAARAIAKHIAALPARCAESVRPGLDGMALAHWLRGLKAELERRAGDVQWRAVQTRNVL